MRTVARPGAVEGMARYGIRSARVLGVPMPDLRRTARTIGRDHGLALALWATGIHDARVLATLVADPLLLTASDLEAWGADLDNWAVTDALCLNLLVRLPEAFALVRRWALRDEEFVRRAAFSLAAVLAVHAKEEPDARFLSLLPLVVAGARDGRNGVKKAVSWALRQIGKRSPALNAAAVETARTIHALGTPAARWIATDALRELTSPAIEARLEKRESRRGK